MCRVLLFLCLLLGLPSFTRAAWIDPNSWSISVDGTASGPINTDSFHQIENVAREFGTRSVAGIADALGTGPGGVPDGTQSSASAEAIVTPGQIAFRTEMDFDHGTALGYSSDARAQAQFHFEVTQSVVTNLELVAEGAHRLVGATLSDGTGAIVWEVQVPEFDVGILWNDTLLPAEFPFRQDWSLAPGDYTLSLGHSTVPLVGTGGPSSFDFKLVPEPSTFCWLWLVGFGAVAAGQLRRRRLILNPQIDSEGRTVSRHRSQIAVGAS